MGFFGGIIGVVSVFINIVILIHIVFAILTSLKILKHKNQDKLLLSLLTIWLVPIFGSIAVNQIIDKD